MMKYFIANHKNLLTKDLIYPYLSTLKIPSNNCKAVICPSNIFLPYFENSGLEIGSQNVSDKIPSNGEVSIDQIASMKVGYCIVGHSDNRINQFESNETINHKICGLLNKDIIPILCVGESREEKENFKTFSTISEEILLGLKSLSSDKVEKIIIAYEPIWAISNGNGDNIIPTNEEIEEVVIQIKKLIKDNYGVEATVLYGGSVNLNNIHELNKITSLDGYLIGASSTKPDVFNKLMETSL